MKFILIFSLSILVATPAIGGGYDRKDSNYRSYKPGTDIGFYTNQPCDFINIDHIVSLKDAHESGAASWSDSKKKTFANDKANHVPSCGRVNSSKCSAVPKDFLRRSRDGKGLDYKIVRWCDYVTKYHAVKIKYALSFAGNTKAIFNQCDLATPQ
jgi:hypothetical protein